jgi:hypothetical protein
MYEGPYQTGTQSAATSVRTLLTAPFQKPLKINILLQRENLLPGLRIQPIQQSQFLNTLYTRLLTKKFSPSRIQPTVDPREKYVYVRIRITNS